MMMQIVAEAVGTQAWHRPVAGSLYLIPQTWDGVGDGANWEWYEFTKSHLPILAKWLFYQHVLKHTCLRGAFSFKPPQPPPIRKHCELPKVVCYSACVPKWRSALIWNNRSKSKKPCTKRPSFPLLNTQSSKTCIPIGSLHLLNLLSQVPSV